MQAPPDDGVDGLHVRANQGVELIEIHCGITERTNRRILGPTLLSVKPLRRKP